MGFIAVGYGIYLLYNELSPASRITIQIVSGLIIGQLILSHTQSDLICADGFLKAWRNESMATEENGIGFNGIDGRRCQSYIDYDKMGDVNPYWAQHLRMRYCSFPKFVRKDKFLFFDESTGEMKIKRVPAKVYVSEVRIFSTNNDTQFTGKVYLWIVKDTKKIAKVDFEG